MKRKPNKPKQESRERPGSWESAADPGGSPGGAGLRTTALLDKVSTSQSSGRKANRSRPPRPSSAWRSAGKSWNGQRISWQNRSRPKKPGPVRRIGRAAGGAAHGFVHGKIYENEQENVGIEGAHRSELVGESGLRHGKRFVQKKIPAAPGKGLSSGPSPNMSRPQRTIISAWPPRSTRKCPATLFPRCGASTA